MKKLLIIIMFLSFFSCATTLNMERLHLETNKSSLKLKYPNSKIYEIRGFSYIFKMVNKNGFYEVNMKDRSNIKIDTVASFGKEVLLILGDKE